MVTAVLILVLLTIAASLASWLFGQWLAGRTRISGAALAVGGAGAVLMIGTSGGEELTQQRLTAELRADACYSRVLDWSRSGQRYGRSPDTLLRIGID
jgi:hypothetical protein